MADLKENAIEWITGEKRATLTISQNRMITKIKKLASKFPDEIKIVAENEDGTILVYIPVSAIKLSIVKKELTEEEKDVLRERLANNRSV